ncbi:hypothetical protein J7J26_02480 [Candidatus Micrarchaeota archaeon]|nr:hypothetical protein [Candidatus Micrarchaeota archaeon]
MELYKRGMFDYKELVDEINSMIKKSIKPKKIDISLNNKRSITMHIPMKYSSMLNEYRKLIKVQKAKMLLLHSKQKEQLAPAQLLDKGAGEGAVSEKIIPENKLAEEVSVSDLLARIRERKAKRMKKKKKTVLSYDEEMREISYINSLDDDRILTYAQEHLPNTYNAFLQSAISKEAFRNRVKYRMALDYGISEITASKHFTNIINDGESK